MKLKGSLLFTVLLLAMPALAGADMLSLTVGGGIWKESPSGTITNVTPGDDVIDVEKEFFWKEEDQSYFFITFEHPVPLIPNVRLMKNKLDHSGSGPVSYTFNGQTFTGNVTNSFNIDQTDLTLYYEILDNVVSLDLGLNIKKNDVDYVVTDNSGNTTTDSISNTIPMLYGLVGVTPYPGLTFSAEGSIIAYSGSSYSDLTAKVSYTSNYFIGGELGYRVQKLELDDVSDYTSNLEFKGPFAGLYLKF